MYKKLISLLLIVSTLAAFDLDKYACEIKSDKGSWGHNYTKYYKQYFEPFKDKPIRFLEIGFCCGLSALLWEAYFTHSQAELHYIDIDPVGFKYMDQLSDRSKLSIVNQANQELKNYIKKIGEVDIIIDDGSHKTAHQIYSFETLFPYLKNGGIYVIEDLFGSYWKELGGAGSQLSPLASDNCTVNFMHNLIHELNYVAARNRYGNYEICPDEIKNTLTYYQKHIEGILFFSNICFIFKR